jgi:hypothetical protein
MNLHGTTTKSCYKAEIIFIKQKITCFQSDIMLTDFIFID